jgi:hypothetical protein
VSSAQGNFTQDIKFNHYKAVLSDLEPNTEYMYRVGKNAMSDTMYFKTAGTGEMTFVWIADCHVYDPLPRRLDTAMDLISTLITVNQDNVDFIFSAGDDVAYGGSYTYRQNLFAREHFKNYMWVTLIGNHDQMDRTNSDNRDDYYLATHNNPPNGYAGQEGASYWFKYGNVLWIVLNSMDLTNTAQIPKAQEWAEEVIRQNPAQYIFVAQHYQWFNGITGNYNSAGFTRWNAFFDKWGVDMAFAGNEHVYVRTHPLFDRQAGDGVSGGTVYFQAPSCDNDRGREMNTSCSNTDKIAFRWTEGARTVGGLLVTVNEAKVKVGLYNRNGVLQDYAEIQAKRPPVQLLP